MKAKSTHIVFLFLFAFIIVCIFALTEKLSEFDNSESIAETISAEKQSENSGTAKKNTTEVAAESSDLTNPVTDITQENTVTSTKETTSAFTETSTEEVTEGTTAESTEKSIAEDVDVPILMYHTSKEAAPSGLVELYVKPSQFELQVKTLKELGYTFCTFDDFENIKSIKKPIMLTFDDGYLENYTEIFPILKKYDAKITLFLIINSITPSNLTEEMIKEMSDSGLVKFESHTLNHPSLIQTSANTTLLDNQLKQSKEKIEAITGKEVLALSYPNGEFNDIVKEYAAKYYKYGLRKDLGMHNTSYDNFEIRRIRINRTTGIETYLKLIGEK